MTPKKIEEMIKYSIASEFVAPLNKDEKYFPVNLMLIAPAECGKTRHLQAIFCKKTHETMDISAKILTSSLIPKLEKGEFSTLIIPDLIQMLSHKKTTRESTVGILNALIEEGIKDSDFFGLSFHLKKRLNCSLLTAVTTEKFMENVYDWNAIGLLHRILPISYNYSESKVNEINNMIKKGELVKEINKIEISKAKQKREKIHIPEQYAEFISLISEKIRDKFSKFEIVTYKGSPNRKARKVYLDIKGFRLHNRLRQLARAICFVDSNNKRKEVNAFDINKLREICECLNFPNTEAQLS